MSVKSIEKLKSTRFLEASSEILPEEFEQVKPNKSAGNCITSHISIYIINIVIYRQTT